MGEGGFVGSALSAALRALGHDVVGAPRSVVDLGDPDAIAQAATGCEVIFHCAGIASARADRRALEWVNIAGTENVINAARAAHVRRVVYLSCANVSLINADRIHWNESRVITQAPLDWHGRSKLLAEEIALAASDQRLEVTALRPAWLWGPGDHTTLPWLCREAVNGGVRLHGSGDNLLASLHIDNLVPALITAATAKNAPGRAYYVADGEVLTAREFLSQLCRACGLSDPRRGIFVLDVVHAWLREQITAEPGLVSTVVQRARGTLFDVQAAVRDLDFTPSITTEVGMQALAAWVTAQGGPTAIAALCRPYVNSTAVDAQVRREREHVAHPVDTASS